MADSVEMRAPILAAGGIVLREGSRPRIAVVRLRRDKSWVLPKGKLYPGEQAVVAARREVLEETGYDVSVREFLGSMSYAVDGKIKIVQFWHMRARGRQVRELTSDVKEVKWVSLRQAIDTLTREHEKVFLANVGPIALKAGRRGRAANATRRDVPGSAATKSSVRGAAGAAERRPPRVGFWRRIIESRSARTA